MNGMELGLVFLKPVDAVRVFQGRDRDVVEPQISQRAIRRTPLVNELPEPSPELLRRGQSERAGIKLGKDVGPMYGLCRSVEEGRGARGEGR
jgi:hypothetical protein